MRLNPWEKPARRIGDDALEALVDLPASELTSLLLEVFARRARRVTPASLRRQFERDDFVTPSSTDQRELLRLDAHVLSRVPTSFEAIELSPVAPFATCSTLGLVHPNQVVATVRNLEVVADSTDILALIAARRRDDADVVRLCTTQRLVRAQRDRLPGHTQSFRILTMVTAGRDRGSLQFEEDAVVEHIGIYVDLLSSLPAPYRTTSFQLRLATERDDLFERIASRVGIPITRDTDRLRKSAYYQTVAFKLDVGRVDGDALPLGDGGMVDWTAKLRADRKERCFTSAIGTELLTKLYRPSAERSSFPPTSGGHQ